MSVGRRKVRLEEQDRWVFNRMVAAYASRPAYPESLVDSIVGLCPEQGKVLDVGAGLGHLAVPLARRGLRVTAVEPARSMLNALEARAGAQGASVNAVHAQAEALPLPDGDFDLVVVADALHFLDRQQTGLEIGRVLAARGVVAIVTCRLARTPFMLALEQTMQRSAPRRPRDVTGAVAEVLALSRVRRLADVHIVDEVPVSWAQLEAIVASISFIGPAMNETRSAAFRERLRAIGPSPSWARTFTVAAGRRGSGLGRCRRVG